MAVAAAAENALMATPENPPPYAEMRPAAIPVAWSRPRRVNLGHAAGEIP